MNYYNEIDPFAAAWLRNLIAKKLIADGDVDQRSIRDVQPEDLRGYAQCHFFAGIGGWPYALRLAEWPDDKAVWTGSCPCQPFSEAGLKRGKDDPRHLWPEFSRLISKREPSIIFGEQIAGNGGLEWLAGVQDDMEAKNYAFAAVDLCSACVGSPTRRQRLYWAASLDDAPGSRQPSERRGEPEESKSGKCVPSVGRLEFWGRSARQGRDGTRRRIEPNIQPLVDGFSRNLGIVRGSGNAINPYVAALFVAAYQGW